MKLTVDIEFNPHLMECRALATLLSKASIRTAPVPLEALLAQDFGLQASPDYPLAALASSVEGLPAAEGYWLRADPVHLIMQRDSFSLGEPVPLPVMPEHAEALLASLNQHFAQDGIEFLRGFSDAWYVRVAQAPQMTTTLPYAVLGRNVHGFMPQGIDAAKWRSFMNELQMLLFEHPANLAREQQGDLAINSVWLSGGGALPALNAPTNIKLEERNLIFANTPLYQGLARYAGIPCEAVPKDFEGLLAAHSQVPALRMQLVEPDQEWFEALVSALKKRQLQALTLNIGWYEQCLVAHIRPSDLYRFWRSTKSVESFLT